MSLHSFGILIVVVFFAFVSAEYYKVITEQCSQLKSSDIYFNDFLLPCGVYE
jgi:hypothetical protein